MSIHLELLKFASKLDQKGFFKEADMVDSIALSDPNFNSFIMPKFDLRKGDCLERMREMEPESFHAIVTDPPYGMSITNIAWDKDTPGYEWAELCLKLLKPGGHIISFGDRRRIHKVITNLELVGFEIRDVINWIYFSAMPTGLNVGRKLNKDEYKGWHTNLKQCYEPAVLARKPINAKNIAEQFDQTQTGALNIDATRFEYGSPNWLGPNHDISSNWDKPQWTNIGTGPGGSMINSGKYKVMDLSSYKPNGRWPANIFHAKKPSVKEKNLGLEGLFQENNLIEVTKKDKDGNDVKSFIKKKNLNPHVTVKPLDLMRWLCKMVCPPGGKILDPFLGSGTTAMAAVLEGFDCVGCEITPKYWKVIDARVGWALDKYKEDNKIK